jgi:hypothetical protein
VQKYFVPFAAGVQAVYNSKGLQYYRHSDWLGKSRFAATSTGSMYYDGAYAPFGENYVETGATDRSFTGQTQDVVQGPTGPFTTWSINAGGGPVRGSLQLSYGGGIWQFSLGLPIPYTGAATPSISVTKVTTKTYVTSSGCGG